MGIDECGRFCMVGKKRTTAKVQIPNHEPVEVVLSQTCSSVAEHAVFLQDKINASQGELLGLKLNGLVKLTAIFVDNSALMDHDVQLDPDSQYTFHFKLFDGEDENGQSETGPNQLEELANQMTEMAKEKDGLEKLLKKQAEKPAKSDEKQAKDGKMVQLELQNGTLTKEAKKQAERMKKLLEMQAELEEEDEKREKELEELKWKEQQNSEQLKRKDERIDLLRKANQQDEEEIVAQQENNEFLKEQLQQQEQLIRVMWNEVAKFSTVLKQNEVINELSSKLPPSVLNRSFGIGIGQLQASNGGNHLGNNFVTTSASGTDLLDSLPSLSSPQTRLRGLVQPSIPDLMSGQDSASDTASEDWDKEVTMRVDEQ